MIGRLTEPHGPAFALLYRPHTGDEVDVLTGTVSTFSRLADLPDASVSGPAAHDLLAVVPYRQITERGFAVRDDGTPLIALSMHDQDRIPLADLLGALPDEPIELRKSAFDVDDADYAELVRTIIADEIGQGAGANFVIRRSFVAEIPNFSRRTALAVFGRLLRLEHGSYWTFLVHTGNRTFIGATPERHLTLAGGVATMNPISGTYRYPPDGPSLPGLLRFLSDRKETDELYMVVDEELKMMGRICPDGGRVSGPFLRQMAQLAHTEYFISGSTSMDVRDLLRETLFAPTVTGSPLENACRVIERHEPSPRGYYAGALALIGHDTNGKPTLDSAIMIRTADIDAKGRMELGVGATLVRHSDPEAEAAETRAKAAGLLAAMTGRASDVLPSTVDFSLGGHPVVRRALLRRNTGLAGYWLDNGDAGRPTRFDGRRVLVIDAEDTFTAMLAHQLRSLGLQVTVLPYDRAEAALHAGGDDLVVLGPGPGDPLDEADRKIATLRSIAADLVRGGTPVLAVCLGHQILSSVLGFALIRRDVPNQGVQQEIDLFGRAVLVGFYNTFTARCHLDRVPRAGVGQVEVSRDPRTSDVHALRGKRFRSFQFHPESVLTAHGVDIVADAVAALLPTEQVAAG
jgi:phenazine biosynthesis protein phzE